MTEPNDRCRSCGDELIIARTGANATVALDPKPNAAGTYDLGEDGFATVIATRRIPEYRVKGIPLYTEHECGGLRR